MRITFEHVVGRRFLLVLLAAIFAFGMIACGDTDGDSDNNLDNNNTEQVDENQEIVGTWVSEWGEEEISETQWGFSPLVKLDKTKRVAITKNDDDADYNPGKFGRIVWTPVIDNTFYYCTVEFDLDTQEDAENSTTVADESDKDGEGCGGFPWTKLTRK